MNKVIMRQAIRLAMENVDKGYGGPFACIVVKEGNIIAEGTNRVLQLSDPTAHAEIVAIRNACSNLQTFQLTGCEIYSSCEPCPMCLGALYWTRPDAIYFGTGREDAAKIGFDDQFIYEEIVRPFALRKIPTQQMLRDEAMKAFDHWIGHPNHKPY